MELEKILNFLNQVEQLKSTARWCQTSTGRQESTAEHSFRLVLMVWLVGQKEGLSPEEIFYAMKMALVHDLGETYLRRDFHQGDMASGKITPEQKEAQEEADMKKLLSYLPEDLAAELFALWQEYNAASTRIARFVKALDKQETMLQVMSTPLAYWDTDKATLDRVALYGNKQVAKSPEVRSFAAVVKARLKKFYADHQWLWKAAYDV